jgi:hypothetical protein
MAFFASIYVYLKQKIHLYTAYVMTLYFFEILYLMFGLLFLCGKTVSIFAGVFLSLLLAFHIIQIFFRKSVHRKIQLFITDVHAAFVIGYLFTSAVMGIDAGGMAILIHVIRTLTLLLELPLIFFLTREDVAEKFI